MSSEEFFSKQSLRSRVKADIVAKYIVPWSRIVGKHARKKGHPIGYLDLFSGPGRYEDGSESTPLLVLRNVIGMADVRDIFDARFNDADLENAARLRQAIGDLPGVELLHKRPRVCNYTFDADIGRDILEMRFPPTLFFIDPFGYKGLTQQLIRGALKDWGCELLFFFNFNRVNAAITNDCVSQHIDELFGDREADELRRRVEKLSGSAREQLVIDHLEASIRDGRARHVQHFAFTNETGKRTSHYLVHVTKDSMGFNIMKEIMAKASSWSDGGVSSFVCGPRPQPTLLDYFDPPMSRLKADLLTKFGGKSVPFGAMWNEHSLGSRFTARNYRDAVLEMEETGQVHIDAGLNRTRRKGTVPDWVTLHFAKSRANLCPAS